MKRLRTMLEERRSDDSGFTLVEAIVAMLVFSIIAVAVSYSITTSLVVTNDARARTAALNLAAQTIDADRATDITKLPNGTTTTTQVVNTTTFTITTFTKWITSGVASDVCGSNGGTLQQKQINVAVSWNGQAPNSAPVFSDTVVSPSSRINLPSLGTIIISTIGASGAGTPGVSVTVTPASTPNGALPLTAQPAATDSLGCAYATSVAPGNYDVTVTKTGGINDKQVVAPTITPVTVVAGTSVSQAFTYDSAATLTPTYVPSVAGAVLPTNLQPSFVSTGATYNPASGSASPYGVYPFPGGYSVVGGTYIPTVGTSASCLSPNPALWTTAASDKAVGSPVAKTAATPGAASSVSVALATVKVSALTSGLYITAVNTTPPSGTGDPGCTAPQTLNFPKTTSTSTTIALPYGTWALYYGSLGGLLTTLVPTSSMSLGAQRGSLSTNALAPSVTLDPRKVP